MAKIMEQHSLSVFEFVLFLLLPCLEALVDESSLRSFVNITDYYSEITTYQAAVRTTDDFYRCKIDILSPLPGYQVTRYDKNDRPLC